MSSIWLRNLSSFSLTEWIPAPVADLEEALSKYRFRGIGALETEHRGFEPVFGQEGLVRKVDGAYWFQVKAEHKKVPGSQLKQLLAERIKTIEELEFRTVGRKEKKELKELIRDELLAKAIPSQSLTTVVVDPQSRLAMVDTSSLKTAENIASLLVHALPGLRLTTLAFDTPVADQMTAVLLEGNDALVADDMLVLKGMGTPAATVRFTQYQLSEPEVLAHLNKGMRPSTMALTWDERLSFVLSDTFALKKLDYVDLLQDEPNDKDGDIEEQLKTLLTLQTAELRELMEGLCTWLGRKADEPGTPADA